MNTAGLKAVDVARLMGLPEPTDEQRAVIEAPLAPQLVVAGAGSGKTETMASRVVYLVATGQVEPRQVLGLTFTRKAAHELAERITLRLAGLAEAMRREGLEIPPGLAGAGDVLGTQKVRVATYNGYALDLVREHALRLGLDPDLKVLSPSASWQLAYDIVTSWAGELDLDASPATVTSALLSLAGSTAEHLVPLHDVVEEFDRIEQHVTTIPLQHEGRRRTMPAPVASALKAVRSRRAVIPLVEEYQRRKNTLGAIDYADQVRLAAQLATNADAVRTTERDLHRLVLLDEFQDTSYAQLVFLTGLYGQGHATCAVGDPQQAIYAWRGASSASLADYIPRAAGQDCPTIQSNLSTSWRNDRAVLAVADRLAAPLRVRDQALRIPVLQPRPGADVGEVKLLRSADTREEARQIAAWVVEQRAHNQGSSAAVLVRARRQIPAIAEALREAGLPVEVHGLGGLLHRPEVADVRALLDCVHDPSRGDAVMRLLTGSAVRLGARDLSVLGRWRSQLAAQRRSRAESAQTSRDPQAPLLVADDHAEEVTLLDALDDLPSDSWRDGDGRELSEAARHRLRYLATRLRYLRRRLALPLPDLVQSAIEALNLDIELLADPERHPGEALRDLAAFRRHAADFERSAVRPGLGAFLALLDIAEDTEAGLALEARESEVDPHAVTVITMHAAKGLEWDVVAVAGMVEGTLPSYDLRRAKAGEDGRVRVRASGWLGPLRDADIPPSLRGDAHALPDVSWMDAATQVEVEDILTDYQERRGEEDIAEDRRLAYVALTRARHALLLSAPAWQEGAVNPREPSRFWREAADTMGADHVTEEDVPAENPLARASRRGTWPPPVGEREARRERIADVVAASPPWEFARTDGQDDAQDGDAEDDVHAGDIHDGDDIKAGQANSVDLEEAELIEAVRRVLADRAASAGPLLVPTPRRITASEVVARATNPERVVVDLLRPLPRRPSASARRGTDFHAWVQRRIEGGALLELDELNELEVFADAPDDTMRDRKMRELYLGSAWAAHTPLEVELPVQVRLGEVTIGGVIDAVFALADVASILGDGDRDGGGRRDGGASVKDGVNDEDGASDESGVSDEDGPKGVVIVDWKTGRPPHGQAKEARNLQLSLYRLAYHDATGLPLDSIRTAFHYVSDNLTVEVTAHPSRDVLRDLVSPGGES
ncbi:ATP-dependent helicase [Devriesea agamarum]|uniref:ATP-dependent helicase n=1 Tax=Devriesea agamarum TaxID=472569 RepID=UPI00071E58C1|nr:ATP-dependent helicase [Devriesea agamarum]